MQVRISDSPDGCEVYEINRDGSEQRLLNVRAAQLNLMHDGPSQLDLRIDLLSTECHAEAQIKTINKDGELKQIKSIEYIDGTVENYL